MCDPVYESTRLQYALVGRTIRFDKYLSCILPMVPAAHGLTQPISRQAERVGGVF